MISCERCGEILQDNINFCPHCGAKIKHASAGRRKALVGKYIWNIIKKLFALVLYLVLTIVYMVVIFVCVYGGAILSGLSVIAFIGAILAIICMGMLPETGPTWASIIPCFIASFIFMFLPLIGEGLSALIEYLRECVLDVVRD